METVKEYIEQFSGETHKRLEDLDTLIRNTNENIVSKISWSMPSYTLNGSYVLQFCVHKNHIGIYALPHAIEVFEKQIQKMGFKFSKGGIQLPNNKPLPMQLIKEMAEFNIKAKTKMHAKKSQ